MKIEKGDQCGSSPESLANSKNKKIKGHALTVKEEFLHDIITE